MESAASAMSGRMDLGGAAEKNEEDAAIRFAHCREHVTPTKISTTVPVATPQIFRYPLETWLKTSHDTSCKALGARERRRAHDYNNISLA